MPTKAKLNTWADKRMRIKLTMVAVFNGPTLIRITLIRIQCGWMQRALLRIIMYSLTSVDRPLEKHVSNLHLHFHLHSNLSYPDSLEPGNSVYRAPLII